MAGNKPFNKQQTDARERDPQVAGLKVPPHSIEAEQSVLGAILLESSCLNAVMEILPRADYFYQVNNRMIYEAMLEMFTEGKPIDYITVLERLRDFEQALHEHIHIENNIIFPRSVELEARCVAW